MLLRLQRPPPRDNPGDENTLRRRPPPLDTRRRRRPPPPSPGDLNFLLLTSPFPFNSCSIPNPAALDSAPNPTAFATFGPANFANLNADRPRRAKRPAIYLLANFRNVANCLIALLAHVFAPRRRPRL